MLDLFGMQVESDYRQGDYQCRATRVHLLRSIDGPPRRRRGLPGIAALRHAMLIGPRLVSWFWRRDRHAPRGELTT